MSSLNENRIIVPQDLADSLAEFRRSLVALRLRECILAVAFVVGGCLVALMIWDRFIDPGFVGRTALFLLVAISVAAVVFVLGRTIWSCRSRLRTAEQIRHGDALFGDHLVGALELAESDGEQQRSGSLCAAALNQVADEAKTRSMKNALPASKTRVLALAAGVLLGCISVAWMIEPNWVSNSLTRLFQPMREIERFTFVKTQPIADQLVVPQDEPFLWLVELDSESRMPPAEATLQAGESIVTTEIERGPTASRYPIRIPALFEITPSVLRIGDYVADVQLVPKRRPELLKIAAAMQLPSYLHQRYPEGETEASLSDGTIQVVEGGRVRLQMMTTQPLLSATVDSDSVRVDENAFMVELDPDRGDTEFRWTDTDGLSVGKPVKIRIQSRPDASPALWVSSDSIPAKVLESQSIKFTVAAADDFGVRRIGLEWQSGNDSGERVLGNGGKQTKLDAFFQATSLSVPSGSVSLRFWVEDDFPGRGRIYSDPIGLNVLTKAEHAVWVSEEFSRWRQATMDLHDRELNLFAKNRELAQVAPSQRDQQWFEALADQARAEQANSRQLQSLAGEGKELLRQAARNEDVDITHVESLAESVRSLEKLAEERMPKVAELLKQASEEESQFAEMVDQESTQANLEQLANGTASDSQKPSDAEQAERIGLPGTTIVDTSKRSKEDPVEAAEQDAVSLAIEDQTDLVADFDQVADELKKLLSSMEGSTLVKRLKSVSRIQDRVAMQLGRQIEQSFGVPEDENRERLSHTAQDIADSAIKVRTILDDLEAFCERREIEHYMDVLEEMKEFEVLQQLKDLQQSVAAEPGIAIASAEFWADNLDRWADDLVDPGEKQPESGPQNNASLPPKVIVEMLRVLESEVNLREQTRMAEQGRPSMERDAHSAEAIRLSEAQDLLRDRLDILIDSIAALPKGELNFGGEMEVLAAASSAMVDATKTLVSGETGPAAIAAETEAIELLLRSRKISAEGAGGSGGDAGGGQGGQTEEAAVAILGEGLNELARDRSSETLLSVGGDRLEVPQQWQKGLDEYFQRLDSGFTPMEQEETK